MGTRVKIEKPPIKPRLARSTMFTLAFLSLLLCLAPFARAQSSCPIDPTLLDLSGLAEACDVEREDLCTSCVCYLTDVLTDAGYNTSELDLDACAVQNLNVLLENGATLAAFVRVSSSCPRDALNCPTRAPPPPSTPPIPAEWLRNGMNVTDVNITDVNITEAFSGIGEPEEPPSSSTGETIGIALGTIFAAGALATVAFCMYRSRRRNCLREKYCQHITGTGGTAERHSVVLDLRRVSCAAGERMILKNVSQRFESGLIGILGPSGCGKTTLLNAIAHNRLVKDGNITLNGERIGMQQVAFVEQSMDLISKLTVFETVSTQAKLKMPWFFSSKEVSDRSKGVLRDMGLEHVSDLRVMGSGLSGGELKRVQVASELVGGDAPLILLDEPASGLDAQTSWRLFSQLRALAADKEKTVIATVHQPSRRIVDLYHRIVVLTHDGRVMWSGPPKEIDSLLTQVGMEVPMGMSTAEWLLDIACDDAKQKKFTSGLKSVTETPVKSNWTTHTPRLQLPEDRVAAHEFKSALSRISVLLWRAFTVLMRQRRVMFSHCFAPIFIGIILGALCNASNDLEGFQNRMGSTFFLLIYFSLASMTIIDLINAENGVIQRQVWARQYASAEFFLCKVWVDFFVLRLVPTLLCVCAFYFLSGLRNSFAAFVTFSAFILLFTFVQSCSCACIAFLCGNSTANATLAQSIAILIQSLWAGYLININRLPAGTRWIRFLSAQYYAFGGILASEMRGGPYKFNADFNGERVVVLVSGETYLDVIGVKFKHADRNLFALLFYLSGAMICGIVAIAFRYRRRL